MAFILEPRVAETSTTTGTGAFTLAGAYGATYRAFSSVCTTNDTVPYVIVSDSGTWEMGIGTYSGANTLTRTSVFRSSNSNNAVNFAAGTKIVMMELPAVNIQAQNAATKATPVDADILPLVDSAASNVTKGLTWANLKATFKSYYDSVSATLTTKTIALGSNTVSGTLAQFNTACTDADFASLAGSETLTSKTLTLPTITASTSTTTGIVGRSGSQLTIGNGSSAVMIPTISSSDTLTNKTIALGSNTVSGTLAQFNTAVTDADLVPTGAATASGLTMATARLLGRTTASSGAIEEITVGTGLTLSGGSLTASGGSPGLVLLATATASSSATIDFTTGIDSTYDEYVLMIQNAIPATNAVSAYFRTSSNGGSSYDAASGNYYYGGGYANSGGLQAGNSSSSATELRIDSASGAVPNAASGGGISVHVWFVRPAATTQKKQFWWMGTQGNTSFNFAGIQGAGWRDSTSAVNAIRFLFSSGAVASGEFKLYGVRKT